MGITHLYEGGAQTVAALREVSITVEPGELAVLLGPSGCGKTTLLNLIAGFFKPTAGSILVDGKPVEHPAPDRMVVFQSHALFDWMTVEQNIMSGMHGRRMTRREKRQRVEELINLVHLDGFADSYPAQLSGGMQQRAGVARALAPQPSVLLLDEPFGALDSLTREQLQDELLEVCRAQSVTSVLVTHSIEEAVYLGDVVYAFTPAPGRIAGTWRNKRTFGRERTSESFTSSTRDLRRLFESVATGVSPAE